MDTGKTCALRLFTWTCIASEGGKEVAPTCPDHGLAEVRSRAFRNGALFICQTMDHVLNPCSYQELEEERKEARARLHSNAAGAGSK
jgi:hypothetical protein